MRECLGEKGVLLGVCISGFSVLAFARNNLAFGIRVLVFGCMVMVAGIWMQRMVWSLLDSSIKALRPALSQF